MKTIVIFGVIFFATFLAVNAIPWYLKIRDSIDIGEYK